MESFDPQILGLTALSSGLAAAMVWLAARMNMLERRQVRRCPACGRLRRHGACGCCG
jgi:hypothetical protein